jgi:hypothetical protein
LPSVVVGGGGGCAPRLLDYLAAAVFAVAFIVFVLSTLDWGS